MERDDSLLHSHVPVTCPYSKPARSSPCYSFYFLKILFYTLFSRISVFKNDFTSRIENYTNSTILLIVKLLETRPQDCPFLRTVSMVQKLRDFRLSKRAFRESKMLDGVSKTQHNNCTAVWHIVAVVLLCDTSWLLYCCVTHRGCCTTVWHIVAVVLLCDTSWLLYCCVTLRGCCTAVWHIVAIVLLCDTTWLLYCCVTHRGYCFFFWGHGFFSVTPARCRDSTLN